MSEPIELIIDPNHQMLRLYCGQCGDSKDITFEFEPDRKAIRVIIGDSQDLTAEEEPEHILSPIEIIV